MARLIEINSDILECQQLQQMPARLFWRKFRAAVKGEANEFSPFIRPARWNVNSREWAEMRAKIFARDNYTCTYCGKRGGYLECDHMHPVSRGGDTTEDNLTTACRECNRRKRAKTADEFRAAVFA